jgi:hypothetical protein
MGLRSCIGESCERLARLLSPLAVRVLVWEGAGCVARSIVEWAPGWAGRGGDLRGWGIVDGIEERCVNRFQELWLNLASIGRSQPLKDSADFVSGSIVHISGLPPAHGLNDPSGS